MTTTLACRLCRAPATFLYTQTLLGRLPVRYWRCPRCDLIETDAPTWLDEAYQSALSALDTGALERSASMLRLTALLAAAVKLPHDAACLDWGAGHGVFVRMARDAGMNFFGTDRYAQQLYARGYEADLSRRYTLVTAFEVWEHFVDVEEELARLFAVAPDYVLVGTVLHEGPAPGWWYFMAETGQHVCFFSERTMRHVAERFGYEAYTGPTTTFFARPGALGAIARRLVRTAMRHPLAVHRLGAVAPPDLIRRLRGMRSRVAADHEERRRAAGGG